MIFDQLNKSSAPKAAITESSELARMIAQNGLSDAGVNVSTDSAMRVTAVYACVMVIAETLAQLPLVLYQRNGREKQRATGHRLYSLLHDMPNSFQTSFDWRLTMTAHMCLRGQAFSLITRSPATGDVLELLPMHPDRVKVMQNRDYSLNYLFRDPDGADIPLRQDQVLRITGLSWDGVNGISPIAYHRQSVGIALAADQHTALTFKNGAKPSGVLQNPGHFSTEDVARRVRESWDEANSGGNAHRTALLEDGLEWKPVSMSNRDAQYIESRTFQVEDIARIFRVPPHKIGHLARSTNNNIEQQALEFVQDTMMPWLVRWEQAITRDLIRPQSRNRYFAKFNVAGLLRGDSEARAAYYTSGITNGWLSPNEARELEDRNPRDGGDSFLQPLNMTESGADA